MTLRQAFPEVPRKTYKTYDNAVAAITKAMDRCSPVFDNIDLRYIIAATPDGRFYPVTLPREEQVQIGINLAHAAGIATFRH